MITQIVSVFNESGFTFYCVEDSIKLSCVWEVYDRSALDWSEAIAVLSHKTGSTVSSQSVVCLYDPELSDENTDAIRNYCQCELLHISNLLDVVETNSVLVQSAKQYYLINRCDGVVRFDRVSVFAEAAEFLTSIADKKNQTYCFLPLREGYSKNKTREFLMSVIETLRERPRSIAVPVFASPDLEEMSDFHDSVPLYVLIDIQEDDTWNTMIKSVGSLLRNRVANDTVYLVSNIIIIESLSARV